MRTPRHDWIATIGVVPDEIALEPVIGGKRSSRAPGIDAVIAELAERQHGVVSRAQLLEIGLGRHAIHHRLRSGRLHQVYRGVYAVGHRRLTKEGRWMAAVLASGPGAVLSHRSAAVLWGLRSNGGRSIEVTTPRRVRARPGIQAHQSVLPADERTVVDGIPVTTVTRTLFDLAADAPRREFERALREAEVLRLTDRLSLPDLVARYPRRRGVATVRVVLAAGQIGARVSHRELQDRFLALVEDAGLPLPEIEALIEVNGRWFEVDCLWRAQRLMVELDGRATHGTDFAFEQDRARDRLLQVHGWRVIRITWRQLHDDPDAVEADLRTLLQS